MRTHKVWVRKNGKQIFHKMYTQNFEHLCWNDVWREVARIYGNDAKVEGMSTLYD